MSQYGTMRSDTAFDMMEKQEIGHAGQPRPESRLERLKRQKIATENETARLDELIQLLEANPTTQRILELLGN
jgi:hypothetical protein